MNKIRIRSLLVVVLAFATGWAGSTISNGKINTGLVTALDSVLGNLLGETTAGAKIGSISETLAVQIDVNKHTAIPVILNMFYPPDPVTPDCEVVAQVQVAGDTIRIGYDITRMNISVVDRVLDPEVVPAPCVSPDPVFPER